MSRDFNSIKLITFDLDNTLWDAEPVLYKAEAAMRNWMTSQYPELALPLSKSQMMALKTKVLLAQPALKGKVSAIRKAVLRQFFLESGFSTDLAEEQAQIAFNIFYQARQKVTLFEDALSTLHKLSNYFQLASLTNGNANLNIIGIHSLFAFSLNAEEIGKEKPAPDIFLKALALSNCRPEQVVHVGDHLEQDVWAAQQVGIQAIWFNPNDEMVSGSINPEDRVRSLSELPDKIAQITSKI
jgi:putative hydrolase of the HAD superfamily